MPKSIFRMIQVIPSFFLLVMLAGPVIPQARAASLTAGGIQFETAESWQETPVRPGMRLFQFEIPGEAGSAEMTVFHFGPGMGGGTDANIERWKGQFAVKDGFEPEVKKLNVNGLTVTTLYLEGQFQTGMGMGDSGPHPDYGMLGAIAEGPLGSVFFKITGPGATIKAARPDFDAFVQTLKPAA